MVKLGRLTTRVLLSALVVVGGVCVGPDLGVVKRWGDAGG